MAYTIVLLLMWQIFYSVVWLWDRCGRDRMVVGFTTTCTISAYHH